MAKIAVKQTPEKEVPTEVLADSIVAISRGVRQLRSGRLTDRALLLLIQDAAPSIPTQADQPAGYQGRAGGYRQSGAHIPEKEASLKSETAA